MRQFMISILCISCLLVHAQDKESRKKTRKWYATPEVDFGFVNRKIYDYRKIHQQNVITIDEIQTGGLSLESFAASYGWHYIFFSKLSLGFVGGAQILTNPGYFALNLRFRLQYFFVDRDNVHLFLHFTPGLPLDKNNFRSGAALGIGLGLPVLKRKDFNIIASLYFERSAFILDSSAKPLLSNEIPEGLVLNTIGLRFGYVSKKGRIKKKYRK